jgi:hypothetical protein
MTALSTLIEPLKRELAVPGTFPDVFPDTSNADLLGSLADGFAEARLAGFFPDVTLTQVGAAPSLDYETDPDLSLAGTAVVVILTSIRILRSQLRNINSGQRYKAGPVEFETTKAASMLKAELDYLTGRLDKIIENADKAARASAGLATVFDGYIARGGSIERAGGLYAYEYRG